MWEKLRIVFTIPELRKKILFTLGLLMVYRIGWWIPLPIINQQAMAALTSRATPALGALFQQVAMFSAAQLNQVTIFGLGIMPYISASIIFQLLGSVWPPLERLQKEGEAGRKKINEYTRYATVLLCIGQSWVYLSWLIEQPNMVLPEFLNDTGHLSFGWQLVTVLTMTCGTIFLMWLGEQIDEFGIGNGISLLIMAGILAGMPGAGWQLLQQSTLELAGGGGKLGIEVLDPAGVPVRGGGGRRGVHHAGAAAHSHAKRQARPRPARVRRHPAISAAAGQSGRRDADHFRQQLADVSLAVVQLAGRAAIPTAVLWTSLHDAFTRGTSFIYNVLYIVLIYFFCYFWTAITFNPKDMAENLKNFGTFIPGYRPGKRDGRLPGKGDGPHHLRGGRLFGGRGHHAHGHRQGVRYPFPGGQLFRRHRAC